VQKWRNWEAAGEADWLLALKRESVIGPLASQSRPGVQRVEEAALELGLGRSVVYDLLKRYRLRPQTSSLLPGKRGREPKLPILRQDREQLFSVAALTRRSISMNAVARSPRRSEARFFVRDLST
jgi:putative transposase